MQGYPPWFDDCACIFSVLYESRYQGYQKQHTPQTGPVLHSHESLPFYLLEKGEVTRFSPPKRVNIPLNLPKTSVSALLELL